MTIGRPDLLENKPIYARRNGTVHGTAAFQVLVSKAHILVVSNQPTFRDYKQEY